MAQKFTFDPKDVEFSPPWFRAFYLVIHNRPPPKHTEEWIDRIFVAYEERRGIVIKAFRGSTKTTTVTQTLTAFYIGCFPHSSNLLIQVGDDIAKDNTSAIATIIEQNPGWRAFFPGVIPNKPDGWGAKGYNVRSDVSGEEWARMRSDDKDPAFIGVGRTAGYIGKHPTGLLILDDIDDENTTSSDRERAKTRKLLTGTIFPAAGENARLIIVIGTPWVENDTLAYVESTGEFDLVTTPVLDEEGNPAWPEKFDEEAIERQRNLAGELEFARMFLLDLERAKGINLKREWLHYYPEDKISPTWPVVMGIDYASTADKLKDKDRDYFSLSVGRLIPGGGAILVDGFRGHVSQGEALQKVQQWAASYPTLTLTVVEVEGIGGQFFETLKYQTALYIHPATTADKIAPRTPSARNKGERFQKQMGPQFEMSRVWVSTRDCEFLKIFKDEWISWPLGEHDDTLDATYYMIYAATMQGALMPSAQPIDTDRMYIKDWRKPRRQENPMKALTRAGQ